jgi:lysophospholipase L1-like esterase
VPSPATARFDQTELLNDFHLGGTQAAAAEELLAGLGDRGLDTAVVVLPVTQDYIDLHPEGAAQYEEFLALAEQIADETGATFLDLHDFFADQGADADTFFADTHHLNGVGANRLSRALPDLLPTDFGSGSRCD